MSQKSIRSSLAKIRNSALYYTNFQRRFHCSKKDRCRGGHPTLRPTTVFSMGDVLHLLDTRRPQRETQHVQQNEGIDFQLDCGRLD